MPYYPPSTSGGGKLRWFEGEWRTTNLLANQAALSLLRATGQSQAAQIPLASRLVGWTCCMSNLGLVDAVAGSPLQVKMVRVSSAGVSDAAVLIGTVLVGESSVSKSSVVNPAFAAGDFAYVVLTTDGAWTSITVDPCLKLEFE